MGVIELLTSVGPAAWDGGGNEPWGRGSGEHRLQVRKTWIGNEASPLGLATEFNLSDLGELPTFESFFSSVKGGEPELFTRILLQVLEATYNL